MVDDPADQLFTVVLEADQRLPGVTQGVIEQIDDDAAQMIGIKPGIQAAVVGRHFQRQTITYRVLQPPIGCNALQQGRQRQHLRLPRSGLLHPRHIQYFINDAPQTGCVVANHF